MRRKASFWCAPFLAILAASVPVSAQIATDRPDFVEAASVVGVGNLQIEASTLFTYDDVAGFNTTTRSTPTLFRVGVSDRLEFRVESEWLTWTEPPGVPSSTGLSDISLGAKWLVTGGNASSGFPATAVLLHAELPTGKNDFGGDGVRPSVRVTSGWDLGNNISIGAMTGLVYDNADSGRFVSGLFGAVLGKGWTERFGTFLEIALGQLASDANGGVVGSFDLGGSYLLTPTVQLDAAAFIGLNSRSDDFAITLGLSALLGK